LIEYFTPEFCEEHEYFDWELRPNGDYVIKSRDFKSIKKKLLARHTNGGLPEIKLTDANFKGKGYMMLEHTWDGRILHDPYVKGVMNALSFLWGNEVFLSTKDQQGEELIYWCAEGTSDVEEEKGITTISREDI
jgi:stage V sporulation protein R